MRNPAASAWGASEWAQEMKAYLEATMCAFYIAQPGTPQ
jgi:hypothetical protein